MAEIKPLQMVVYEGNADLQTAGGENESVALAGNGSSDSALQDNADLQAVDGEGEFATEEIVAGCDDPATGKFMELMKGMVFDSENDAITFSQRYAQNKGFTMIRRTSKTAGDTLKYFTLACNRQGKDQCSSRSSSRNKLTHNSSTKTQCPAKLNFRLHGPDKFCLTSLILEHNHDLSPSEIGVYVCQNKTAGVSAKSRTESSGRSEVCANKMTIFTHAKGGGSENQQETTPSSEDQQFGKNERTDNSKEEMMMYRGSADPQTSGGEDESVALPDNRSTGAAQEGNADLPAVDAEGEFATEEIGAGSDDPAKGRVMEPIKGMIFDSENDAVTFGQRYAQNKGFAIIRRTSRAMDEKLQYFTLACNRQGKAQFSSRSSSRNKLKHNPSTKTQCPAKLNFRLHGTDKFCLTSLILEHNHDLSPSETRVSVCQNKTPVVSAKRRREPSRRSEEVCANKMIIFTHAQGGGSEDQQFGENECTDNSKEETRLKFSAEDTHVLYRYFFRMQSKNPNFFYAMDFDENSRLRSVFWADARSRAAYESFSDVVKFDTACLTNKYEVPLSSFVGLNHHGEPILLGCGLLSNQNAESFVWLFKSWLACMSNKPPKGMITDQCDEMQDAVEQVFPQTYHIWCLLSVIKKIPEALWTFRVKRHYIRFLKCGI